MPTEQNPPAPRPDPEVENPPAPPPDPEDENPPAPPPVPEDENPPAPRPDPEDENPPAPRPDPEDENPPAPPPDPALSWKNEAWKALIGHAVGGFFGVLLVYLGIWANERSEAAKVEVVGASVDHNRSLPFGRVGLPGAERDAMSADRASFMLKAALSEDRADMLGCGLYIPAAPSIRPHCAYLLRRGLRRVARDLENEQRLIRELLAKIDEAPRDQSLPPDVAAGLRELSLPPGLTPRFPQIFPPSRSVRSQEFERANKAQYSRQIDSLVGYLENLSEKKIQQSKAICKSFEVALNKQIETFEKEARPSIQLVVTLKNDGTRDAVLARTMVAKPDADDGKTILIPMQSYDPIVVKGRGVSEITFYVDEASISAASANWLSATLNDGAPLALKATMLGGSGPDLEVSLVRGYSFRSVEDDVMAPFYDTDDW